MADRILHIDDFVEGRPFDAWSNLPSKPTLAIMKRHSDGWHEELAAAEEAEREKRQEAVAAARRRIQKAAEAQGILLDDEELDRRAQGRGWSTPIDRIDGGSLRAVALSTQSDLSDEGGAMHHCVSNYGSSCRSGSSLILSIRRDGRRAATLELRRGASAVSNGRVGPSYSISQIKGPCNAQIVDPEVLAFAERCAVEATDALHRILAERAAKSKARAPRGRKVEDTSEAA